MTCNIAISLSTRMGFSVILMEEMPSVLVLANLFQVDKYVSSDFDCDFEQVELKVTYTTVFYAETAYK